MRRPSTVEVMLLTTIVLWSLNLTVSRYILTHGFQPLAYATVRYGLAVAVFIALTLLARAVAPHPPPRPRARGGRCAARLPEPDRLRVRARAVLGVRPRADPGATPIFAALAGVALRTETLPPRFWAGAVLSFVGVALVAVGSGSQVSGDAGGVLLGLVTAATWAGYSMAVTPLMSRYSARRISAVVLGAAWVGIALTSVPQVRSQDWSLGWEVWALLVFATLGPLVLTNELWFRSLDRIGPARATLAANLQPFLAAALAVVLLSETLAPIEIAGGILIGAGILVARRRRVSAPPSE